jgi:Arc/MetJ-type ribon-helix-helix transcriptional regulator
MMTWYDDGMRTIIDLPHEQIERLAALCAQEHISRAEAVRRAVAALLDDRERRQRERKEALQAGFGVWAPRDFDARTYVDEIRSEWDERELRQREHREALEASFGMWKDRGI